MSLPPAGEYAVSFHERILLTLLQWGTPHVERHRIARDAQLPAEVVDAALRRLADDHLLQVDEASVRVSANQRLDLAVLALQQGVDIERVCQSLGWQAFEDLVALMLEANGFSTQKHYRFKTSRRRFEIDVLGLKKPLVLLIECKRWARSWQRSATMKIVEQQLTRTTAFVNDLPAARRPRELRGWREAWVLPLVLTLSETPVKTYQQVPVIPIFYFHAFLLEDVYARLDEAAFHIVGDEATP